MASRELHVLTLDGVPVAAADRREALSAFMAPYSVEEQKQMSIHSEVILLD